MIFGKKYIETEDKWEALRGGSEEKPIFLRVNSGAEKVAGKGLYDFRAGIAYKFIKPNEFGLPDSVESKTMSDIETTMDEAIKGNKNVLMTLIITTEGFKEYVFYHNNQFKIDEVLDKIKAKYKEYEFTTYMKKDKKWEVFFEYR